MKLDRTNPFATADVLALVRREALDVIRMEVPEPAAGYLDEDDDDTDADDLEGVELHGSVAVIRVSGPLAPVGTWWCQGYDQIARALIGALALPAVTSVVMLLDSGGGTAAGCFDAVRAMRKAKLASGKRVVAVTQTRALSGAYALASLADEIVCSDTACVGSVGVIASLVSQAKALADNGIDVRVIASGTEKTDGHPAVPISDAAVERMTSMVEMFNGIFASEVSIGRPGLTPAKLAELDAGVRYGRDAVAVGLADRVGTFDDVLTGLRTTAAPMTAPGGFRVSQSGAVMARNQGITMDLNALAANLAAMTGKNDLAEIAAELEAMRAKAARVDAAEARVATIEKARATETFETELRAGLDAGKLTPAMANRYREKQAAGRVDAAELKADLAALPVVVDRSGGHKQPVEAALIPGGNVNAETQGLATRPYASLNPDERNKLWQLDAALHDSLRDQWVAAGRPAPTATK